MNRGFPDAADMVLTPPPSQSLFWNDVLVYGSMPVVAAFVYFRFIWLPRNRPQLYRAMLIRNAERKRREAEQR